MKISASLRADGCGRLLPDLVSELDACQIDYLHMDCNDEPSVLEDIVAIRGYSRTPIDLHVIAAEPLPYLEAAQRLAIERVCFQYEALASPDALLASLQAHPLPGGCRYGLALGSKTSLSSFSPYAEVCDFVLLMTTTPGHSGGRFDPQTFRRIHRLRRQFPRQRIHIDGGVNDEVGFILRMLGVHAVVSGAFLMGTDNLAHALLKLKRSVVHSDYLVQDFMLPLEETPHLVVSPHDKGSCSLRDVMAAIETYGMGFVCFVDETERFLGLTSHADLRRGMLRGFEHISELRWGDVCNHSPVSVSLEANICELLSIVQRQPFLVSFLPVVAQQRLCGALTFHHLIQSET